MKRSENKVMITPNPTRIIPTWFEILVWLPARGGRAMRALEIPWPVAELEGRYRGAEEARGGDATTRCGCAPGA